MDNLHKDEHYDFESNKEETEDKKYDLKKNSCIVTLDLVLNTGSDIFGSA